RGRAVVALRPAVRGVPATLSARPPPDLPAAAVLTTRVHTGPARELLGWTPRRTLRDAIEALWLDARQERKPAQPVR
ncbi:hypothetical protein, partial [Amycolatopsis sp. NPDC054798]